MYNGLHNELHGELRLQATAHLAKTMELLLQNHQDLAAEIARELDTNPMLEVVEELRCPECGRRLRSFPCGRCAKANTVDDVTVFFSTRGSLQAGQYAARPAGSSEDDDDLALQRITQPVSLAEHVLRQIGPAMTHADERRAAEYILARLDEHGLLPEAAAEIALYLNLPLRVVQQTLRLIQQADPVGLAVGSPRESLLLQLAALAEIGAVPTSCRALLIEDRYFEAMANQQYDRLARWLNCCIADVEQAVQFIRRNLTPYPAQASWGNGGEQTVRQAPDAAIYRNPNSDDGGLVIEIFSPVAGWLRVAPEYKALVQQLSEAEGATWQTQLDRATLLTKCLQQRNHTLKRILMHVVCHQRAFVEGSDGDLGAMTRASVAEYLALHESTVSRAGSNKTVALPSGRVVPLSKFFDRSLAGRTAVQEIVENEARPLSDAEIAEQLREQGYEIARRTVAKYRNMLGILPANLRSNRMAAPLAA